MSVAVVATVRPSGESASGRAPWSELIVSVALPTSILLQPH